MQSPVDLQIFVVYPPDREGRVAQLCVQRAGKLDIPAEVFRQDGQTMITLFSRDDGPAWTYPLAEFGAALDAARAIVAQPYL